MCYIYSFTASFWDETCGRKKLVPLKRRTKKRIGRLFVFSLRPKAEIFVLIDRENAPGWKDMTKRVRFASSKRKMDSN